MMETETETIMGIRISHKMVAQTHVYTSPDLPGLYVAHKDQSIAYRDIKPSIEMLRDMASRQEEKDRLHRIITAA